MRHAKPLKQLTLASHVLHEGLHLEHNLKNGLLAASIIGTLLALKVVLVLPAEGS